jgi:hypothetical protein
MFQKGNKVYAEVGNYLRHKTERMVGLTIIGNIEDFEETPLNEPLDIVVEKDMFFFNNRMFACKPETMDYAGIKTKLITSRYSNDDQMALILNHGKSEEDTELFDKMQEWRDWAGEVAKIVAREIIKT